MHRHRSQCDTRASSDHCLNPVVPLAASDDLRLEALLSATLKHLRAHLAMNLQQEVLALEVVQAHGFLSFEAMARGKDHNDALLI